MAQSLKSDQLDPYEKLMTRAFFDPRLPRSAMLTHMREDGFIHTGNLVKPMFIDEVGEVVPAILLSADEARVDRGTKAIIDRL